MRVCAKASLREFVCVGVDVREFVCAFVCA